MPLQLRVYVPPHPLIQHWLGVARDAQTPAPLFRTAMAELGRWLTYEALREWLPVVETEAQNLSAYIPTNRGGNGSGNARGRSRSTVY